MWKVVCIAALLALPASAAPAVTVPLEVLRTKHIAVSVRVNGEGPFRLVLDTGSPVSFLSGKAAQKSGLISADVAARPVLMGMRGQAVAKSLEVGGARVKDLSVLVLDHPTVDALAELNGPIDGLVGYSFFARFRTTIDYARGQVSFTPVDYQPRDVMSNLMTRLMTPETARTVIAPPGLWGLVVEKPDQEDGVLVKRVYPGSAAAAAGLRAGDRLLTLDGRWTESVTDCWEAAAAVRPGTAAVARIRRNGQEREVRIKPRLGL